MKTLTFDIIALICEFALYGPKNYESTKAFIEAYNMTFEYIKMGEENNKMIKFMNRQEKQLISRADLTLWTYNSFLLNAFDAFARGIEAFTYNKLQMDFLSIEKISIDEIRDRLKRDLLFTPCIMV